MLFYFTYLVHLLYAQFIPAPALKEAQGVLIALKGFRPELSAAAIDHKLVDLIIKA